MLLLLFFFYLFLLFFIIMPFRMTGKHEDRKTRSVHQPRCFALSHSPIYLRAKAAQRSALLQLAAPLTPLPAPKHAQQTLPFLFLARSSGSPSPENTRYKSPLSDFPPKPFPVPGIPPNSLRCARPRFAGPGKVTSPVRQQRVSKRKATFTCEYRTSTVLSLPP